MQCSCPRVRTNPPCMSSCISMSRNNTPFVVDLGSYVPSVAFPVQDFPHFNHFSPYLRKLRRGAVCTSFWRVCGEERSRGEKWEIYDTYHDARDRSDTIKPLILILAIIQLSGTRPEGLTTGN